MSALLVWSLAYFVILPHSCSFLHMLEIVAPAQREQSLRKTRNISGTAGKDLQRALRGHLKLCPPWLDWRSIKVLIPGCEAQIQEMVLCCGSTACANALSTLCAQYWSYPVPSLGERVSVTVVDASLSLPECQQLTLPLTSHHTIPQALSCAQHLQALPAWLCLHGRLGR